jgi:hypothetical protein
MEPSHEILKDPVHGYIKLYDYERKIVDTPIFQRLRRIKQLTVVDYAYPGAVHTRFSHSLGVMHVAGVFTQELMDKIPGISPDERQKYYYLMRLWGLVHDIGHGPFSHLFDDEVLGRLKLDHETLGARIVSEYPRISNIQLPEGISVESLSSMMKSGEEWPMNGTIGGSGISEQILSYVATGPYSADLIDYLLRDSLFTGAGYGAVDWRRLIALSYPYENRVVLDSRAEDALDSFLLARLFMFTTVYYHRTVRAFYHIAGRYLRELNDRSFFDKYTTSPAEYAKLDENVLYSEIVSTGSELGLMLLDRKNPYSTVEEKPLKIEHELVAEYLDGESMTRSVSQAMAGKGKNLSEEAFFIDTPMIAFNPMLQEPTVHFKDLSGEVRDRNVWETRWGRLSEQMGVARLYIHDNYTNHKQDLRDAFLKPSTRPKTHF